MNCRKLLLVEDDVSLGLCVRMALLERAVEVSVIHLGGDTLRALQFNGWDALVLDLTLPDMDGAVVAAMVRRDWPELPIVITSGHLLPERVCPLLTNSALSHSR